MHRESCSNSLVNMIAKIQTSFLMILNTTRWFPTYSFQSSLSKRLLYLRGSIGNGFRSRTESHGSADHINKSTLRPDQFSTSASAWLPAVRAISLQSFELRGGIMPNLIVRNVPEDVIKALKKRAGRHGISAEAEHRKILTQALLKTRKRSFAEAIAAMPNVGRDSDFERVQDTNRHQRCR
jgi:antitoxin FitA